ncbi:MAG: hypothetical protein KDA22_07605 [Phycisphaerales bacterium]|nr:hypothetical protein [Phycisphaerales bacterium]
MSGCSSQRKEESVDPRIALDDAVDRLRVDPADMQQLLRREFFSRAGAAAARYGVSPDRLVRHALRLRADTPFRAARLLSHLEDLTHAIACIDDCPLAWSDLVEMHELVLIHVCADRLGEAEGIVHVRRWMASLRRGTAATRGTAASAAVGADGADPHCSDPSMHAYTAQRPLRHWLAERAMTHLPVAPRRREPIRLHLTDPEIGVRFSISAGPKARRGAR